MTALETMTSLKVRGPFRGGSGHDYHTRAFVRGFARLGTAVELEEFTDWCMPLPPALQDPYFDQLSAAVPSATQVQFVMPPQVALHSGLRVANYTMFEATPVPLSWAARANECAMTVVPTQSSFDAWVAAGVAPARLRRCPLGVRAGLDDPSVAALALRTPSGRPVGAFAHRFLNIGEMIPRKNQLGLVAAWVRATAPADDAVLVMKLNQFRYGLAEPFVADVNDVFRAAGGGPESCAPFVFITDYLPDADAAVETMRAIIDDRAPAKRSPQQRICEEYAWDKVSRRLLDVLAELA